MQVSSHAPLAGLTAAVLVAISLSAVAQGDRSEKRFAFQIDRSESLAVTIGRSRSAASKSPPGPRYGRGGINLRSASPPSELSTTLRWRSTRATRATRNGKSAPRWSSRPRGKVIDRHREAGETSKTRTACCESITRCSKLSAADQDVLLTLQGRARNVAHVGPPSAALGGPADSRPLHAEPAHYTR